MNLLYLYYVFNRLFTYIDDIEGKVGIGKIPSELLPALDTISEKYSTMIPNKNVFTYHTYYMDLQDELKTQFDTIQYHPFWENACDNTNNCIMRNVYEMNEVYYSNPKPNFEQLNLYGAAANLIPHRDCVLYRFHGIRFYRIIIGLTNGNNDTSTEFIHLNINHKINRGDYMIFDFDKTFHRVKKTGQQETPRILLKMHFIVCENCKYSNQYITFITGFYKYYYFIARYTEQIGTDPATFVGFFFGLLWEWPFHVGFKYIVLSTFAGIVIATRVVYKIKRTYTLMLCSILQMCMVYVLIVLFYYTRYLMFNIK